METLFDGVFYTLTFLSLYIQVFFFVTFFENRKKIILRSGSLELSEYPGVTIIVPCYNEEKTLSGTIDSLRVLDYPKEKLSIIIVDDGSTDTTWDLMQVYKDDPQIQIFRKENGGKHTALNLGLQYLKTPFIGCLDADSFVDTHALKRIMTYFLEDPETMAVAPSIIVNNPSNIIQKAQKAEYDMAVYNKKMLGFMGAIHVTPGPFSIFRKKVFDDLGPYRKAHNTEDQEIALRMQEHGYKIEHCPDAYVYTNSPDTIPKLYRQRLRWIYGFIKNAIDYRRMVFRRRYGNVALFTVPSGIISIVSVVFLLGVLISNVWKFIADKILLYKAVGFQSISFGNFHFDWFFLNTRSVVFVSVILYCFVVVSLLMGRSLVERRPRVSIDILYFFVVYGIVAPFWLLKAVWNAIRSRESSWTLERKPVSIK